MPANTSEPLSATNNAIGLAGFITSIVGIVSCGVLSPIGLILSFIGLFKRPRGFAVAGTIIGFIGSLGIIIVLLVVGVVVIGLLAAALSAGPGGFEMLGDSFAIHAQLENYQQQHASLPADISQLTGVTADELKDHWGNEYIYKPDLVNNSYQLISKGPDGAVGTADDISFDREVTFTGPRQP